ncbi:TPA: hypothetical protein N2D04_003561 [Clostridium botulinum]|nr:hypothetical protein [Clostridium botulinum]NFB61548.1 hypothetical protein [Clostridium botulinum]HCL4448278.1 hypothetical protein [Clostridium botulinum]HCL4459387.1 hypothetical protein [Clostridium botulinum]HCL4463137.1 hypothetical protein [Clostridium botulinum]
MIKIKAMYSREGDKEKLLQELNASFNILKVSKEYKKEGQHRRIYIDLEQKNKVHSKGTNYNPQF